MEATLPTLHDLPASWQNWLIENTHRGCSLESINAELVKAGYTPREALPPADAPTILLALTPRTRDANLNTLVDTSATISFALDSPHVAVIDNFLSKEECNHLRVIALPTLNRSSVIDRDSGQSVVDAVRTSDGAYFQAHQDNIVAAIEQRIADMTGTPVANGEPMQVLRYRPEDQYRGHHDFFDPADPGSAVHLVKGQRIATVLLYLNDVTAGGATYFPELGLSVRPVRGRALYFEYPASPCCGPDKRLIHAGTPVTAGEKWVATRWIRDRAYT